MDLPRYLFPFIKNATDVPGVGLCSFAALAVSLGRSPDAAPEVRAEILQAVNSRLDWWKKHIPIITTYAMDHLLSILDRDALTAPSSLWLPMPLGAILAANTFNRAVVYYTSADVSARFCVPYFTKFSTALAPIAIGFVGNCHFISLELDWEDTNLPVPHLDVHWKESHTTIADGWGDLLKPNRVLFRTQAKIRSLQDDIARGIKRDGATVCAISVSSDDNE